MLSPKENDLAMEKGFSLNFTFHCCNISKPQEDLFKIKQFNYFQYHFHSIHSFIFFTWVHEWSPSYVTQFKLSELFKFALPKKTRAPVDFNKC